MTITYGFAKIRTVVLLHSGLSRKIYTNPTPLVIRRGGHIHPHYIIPEEVICMRVEQQGIPLQEVASNTINLTEPMTAASLVSDMRRYACQIIPSDPPDNAIPINPRESFWGLFEIKAKKSAEYALQKKQEGVVLQEIEYGLRLVVDIHVRFFLFSLCVVSFTEASNNPWRNPVESGLLRE